MKVEYEIYQLISKASGSQLMLSEQVSSGLAEYVADNGLDNLLGKVPGEQRMHYLEMFMQPVLSLPQKEILLYFETYSLRLAFVRTINKIQSEAEKKLRDSDYRCNLLSALLDEFNSTVREISRYPGMHERFARKISDCMLDLDYIAGKSENISTSLAQRTGLQV